MKVFGCTHPGPRTHNEDCHGILELDDTLLFIVADGLGGHNAGEVANNLAVKVIQETIRKDCVSSDETKKVLAKAIEKANREIFDLAAANPEYSGMGTTVVAVLVNGNKAVVANVGDSRAYLIDGAGIHRVSKNHSVVQSLLDIEAIDEEEAFEHLQKNVVPKTLGLKEKVDGDYYEVDVEDVLLLCTNGLHDHVQDEEIAGIVVRDGGCEGLVNLALSRGGKDNVTIVLFKMER